MKKIFVGVIKNGTNIESFVESLRQTGLLTEITYSETSMTDVNRGGLSVDIYLVEALTGNSVKVDEMLHKHGFIRRSCGVYL